jgi:hypothetical protein
VARLHKVLQAEAATIEEQRVKLFQDHGDEVKNEKGDILHWAKPEEADRLKVLNDLIVQLTEEEVEVQATPLDHSAFGKDGLIAQDILALGPFLIWPKDVDTAPVVPLKAVPESVAEETTG